MNRLRDRDLLLLLQDTCHYFVLRAVQYVQHFVSGTSLIMCRQSALSRV